MSFPLSVPAGPYFWASNASLKIENGPVGKDCQASLGNARAELAARRIKGGLKMGRFATRARRGAIHSQTSVVRNLRQPAAENLAPSISEKEVAAAFAAVTRDYSKNDLSDLSERTPEAAKHWKDKTRAPNSSSLITMARRNTLIQAWVAEQIGLDLAPVSSADEVKSRAELQLAANMPGQFGAIAREMLRKMDGGN